MNNDELCRIVRELGAIFESNVREPLNKIHEELKIANDLKSTEIKLKYQDGKEFKNTWCNFIRYR